MSCGCEKLAKYYRCTLYLHDARWPICNDNVVDFIIYQRIKNTSVSLIDVQTMEIETRVQEWNIDNIHIKRIQWFLA